MGKAIVAGGGRATEPVTGTPLGDLAVGSSIYLNENGSPVDYIVVNQGIPSNSSLYDSSCDGTWLLRKDCYEQRQWHSSDSNSYKASTIYTYLNGTFFGLFDGDIQNAIQQVKIPYVNGTAANSVYTISSGTEGLAVKVFLLSGYEIGFTQGNAHIGIPIDGSKLDYFTDGSGADTKRIAYLNGATVHWWTRSPFVSNGSPDTTVTATKTGAWSNGYCSTTIYGVRPALILPSNAKLQDDGTIKV